MSNLETAVEKLKEFEANQKKHLANASAGEQGFVYFYLDGIKKARQEMEYQLKVEKGTNLW